MPNLLNCRHFECGECRSCQWLAMDYPNQIGKKTAELHRLLAPFGAEKVMLPPVHSPLSGFRNKAKMVVSGSVERPVLGLLRDQNDPTSGVDLTDCPLYPSHFEPIFTLLKNFIGRAGLVPYNIAKKKGELKYILLSESRFNRALLVRFVLNSERKRSLIERELPNFLSQLPSNSVVSLNIQPQHAAILEGEQEIILTPAERIEERFNDIPLFIRPQGFFQTNPTVASQLYHTAQQWLANLPISHCWDLFCGVGGFGLHVLKALQAQNSQASLVGIEISPQAIASASQSAERLGLNNISFRSLDSAQFALTSNPELRPDTVIVNPPRRGIGKLLAQFLNELASPYLLYSSCNAQTMATDLSELSHYQLNQVQLFDMFPHTAHYEVLALLSRK